MIERALAGALAAGLGMGSAAYACPEPTPQLLFHSCWGESTAHLRLLPEEAEILNEAASMPVRVVVTGGYTGKDKREGDLPKPVGLFVHSGRIINPNLGRMDGIVIMDPGNGTVSIQHRGRVTFAGETWDLTDPDRRAAFAERARIEGRSVFQSHLLITDGQLDVRDQDDAPKYVRRLLVQDTHGFAVFQSDQPTTLFEAAEAAQTKYAPRMALNLDMGSYDYCLRAASDTVTVCGVLGRRQTSRLSNVLDFSVTPGD